MNQTNHRRYQILYSIASFLALVIIILVFTWTSHYLGGFAWEGHPLHQFNYHPVLAVLGLIVLYGKGMLLYRTFPNRSKSTLKLLHTITMLIIFILSVISLKSVFDSHDKRKVPIPNLYSLHSWIGLGTVILFASQLFCGFIAFVYPGVHLTLRKTYMQYHQFFGTTIFILSIISCHSGIMEKAKGSLGKEYLNLPPPAFVANFLGVTITVFGIIILYLASAHQFKRKSLPEEDKISLELH